MATASGAAATLRFRNRALTIFRGIERNRFGDRTNVGTPLYTDVPAALAEESSETFDAASQTRRTIRTISCVFDNWVDVTADDALFDPASGLYYLIESIQLRPGIGFYPPQKLLTLRMRSGVTPASD